MRNAVIVAGLLLGASLPLFAEGDQSPGDEKTGEEVQPLENPTPAQVAASQAAFATVAKVLMHPRCSNCHPRDDVPTQTMKQTPHKMNISRVSAESGLPCHTCHQEKNSEALGIAGGPPGAPHWGLPPKEFPAPFQGHTPHSLCEQLKDPKQNGNRSLSAIHHHLSHDPLVLWAWNPGGAREKPPVTHKQLMDASKAWVLGGGALLFWGLSEPLGAARTARIPRMRGFARRAWG